MIEYVTKKNKVMQQPPKKSIHFFIASKAFFPIPPSGACASG